MRGDLKTTIVYKNYLYLLGVFTMSYSTDKWFRYIREEKVAEQEPEQELEEVENPLDVRVYEIDYFMDYPLGQGFEIADIHDLIRSIPNVTTVRTVGEPKRISGNRTRTLQRLKFVLQGRKNRMAWARQVLVPSIKSIDRRIRVTMTKRAKLFRSSKVLKEFYAAYNQRQSYERPTPRGELGQMISDWAEGGVMYDAPTMIGDSSSHVMMPVEEIKHLLPRQKRKHGHHYDAGYKKFIEEGPTNPIYIAIGKNRKVKITGNEDELRYAIEAGVEEVPVFFSYQTQV